MQAQTVAEPRVGSDHHPEPRDSEEYALSVVIPCLNGADTVGSAVELLVAQGWTGSWEIVVADNGSTDGTPQVVTELASRYDNVRLVEAAGPRRAAFARNVGARAARGRSIAFFDADDIPDPAWLGAMGEALAEHDFVACRLDTESLNEDWTAAVRGRPQSTGLLTTSVHPFLPAASGGTIGIRRSLFLELGGFDQDIPGGSEDIEICWRVQLAGHPLEFVPDAVVKMRFRHTRRDLFAQARKYARGHRILRARFRDVPGPDEVTALPPPSSAWVSRAAKLPGMLWEIHSRGGRARWIWRLGWYAGLCEGYLDSIAQRRETS